MNRISKELAKTAYRTLTASIQLYVVAGFAHSTGETTVFGVYRSPTQALEAEYYIQQTYSRDFGKQWVDVYVVPLNPDIEDVDALLREEGYKPTPTGRRKSLYAPAPEEEA